jgi:hypothetical protein
MNWLTWFAILYYPLLFLILFIGHRVRPSRKTDLRLGCALMAVLGTPFVYSLGQIAYLALFKHNP